MTERRYRLSEWAENGILHRLRTVIAETQDGAQSCIEIRTAAATSYREKYPQ